MRTRALVVLLLWALPGSLIAIERDRSFETSTDFSRDRSAASRAAVDDPKAIDKLISDINAAARKDKSRMMSIIVINTNVAATTLEQEKARTGLTLGDVYVAHALSLATRKKVNAMFALKASGQSWAQIARTHNVALKGAAELRAMMRN